MKAVRELIPLTDSATVMINTLANQKIAAGIKIYNLSAGEPKLPPHPSIIKSVLEALEQGKTLYPPVSGITELKISATKWMNDFYGCHFETDECLVVNGGKFGIYLLLQLLLKENDEVIISSPYWVSYPTITQLFGGRPIIVTTNESEDWKITPENLKKACTTKSKILILNNACNPTGTLYTKSELAALLDIAQEHDLLVISDEVYSGLSYDEKYISCGEFVNHKERVVIIQSCSKNFSMTGWRVGFVFSENQLIKQLTSLISQSTSGVTTISQWAAVAALNEANTINQWVKDTMLHRRNLLIELLHDSFGINIKPPPSSLYVFLSLHQLNIKNISAIEFCKHALEKANVALVPGDAFGEKKFIRFSFGSIEEDLRLGIHALANFCNT